MTSPKKKRCPICKNSVVLIYFDEHMDHHRNPYKLIYCKYCGAEHDGLYGSGVFCSPKCARGFSSQEKRQEINKKVSQKLKGRTIGISRKGRKINRPSKFQTKIKRYELNKSISLAPPQSV